MLCRRQMNRSENNERCRHNDFGLIGLITIVGNLTDIQHT